MPLPPSKNQDDRTAWELAVRSASAARRARIVWWAKRIAPFVLAALAGPVYGKLTEKRESAAFEPCDADRPCRIGMCLAVEERGPPVCLESCTPNHTCKGALVCADVPLVRVAAVDLGRGPLEQPRVLGSAGTAPLCLREYPPGYRRAAP